MRDEVKAKKLEKLLYYTPYSRDEFNNTYIYNAVDEIEQARMTIVRSFMGFGSRSTTSKHRTGFRISCRNNHYPHIDFASYPKIITQFTERLRGVIIENRDAMQVMKKFDSKETLHYIDPPYIASLRNKSHAKYAYSKEMTDREHEELCEFVKTLQGYVVCSGYNNDIYNTILDSWAVYSKETIAEKAKRTVECLWLSPRTAAALTAKRPRLTGIA
jgi:DNA adenine methylase